MGFSEFICFFMIDGKKRILNRLHERLSDEVYTIKERHYCLSFRHSKT